ncbi:MAG: universal stress protein, partial [Candidatus Hydrogenedens sp.]
MSEQDNNLPITHKVLFCTDFSENADIAFQHALDIVLRRPGSLLIILHVIPEPEAEFWKTYVYEIDDIDKKAKQDIDENIRQSYL